MLEPHDAIGLMEAGSERTEAELVASEVLAALRDGVDPQEIVVVCRSLARSAELFERTLGRYGVATTSARRVPLGHTALGRALLGLARYALLPGSQRKVEDLIAYLRRPGLVDSPETVDLFEREVRQQAGRTGSALRKCGRDLRVGDVGARAAAPGRRQHLLAIAESTRMLLAAPHRGAAPVLRAAEQLDVRAAATVFQALEELEQLGDERTPVAELIELLEGLQVPAHGTPPAGAVLIAEPLAIRARRFRRVFVTGLCADEFPSPQAAVTDPFLGDDRRRELALSSGLALPQPSDPLDRERYLLYACVSRATERVVFSYRSSDEDGNVVIASPFLDDIADLFPDDWRERRRRRLLADVVWSSSLRRRPTASGCWLRPSRRRRTDSVLRDADGPATRILSEQALSHVRHRQIVSAGALEAFAACPVRWLVERQLQPEQLEPDPDAAHARLVHSHGARARVREARWGAHPADARRAPSSCCMRRCAARGRLRPLESGRSTRRTEVRAAILRGIEAELLRYLRTEAADGCDWPPIVTELRFGLDAEGEQAMPPVALDDGRRAGAAERDHRPCRCRPERSVAA